MYTFPSSLNNIVNENHNIIMYSGAFSCWSFYTGQKSLFSKWPCLWCACFQVRAVDNDRGDNGNITYSIVTSPLQPKQFEVNPTNGRVVTAVKFDRETQFSDRGVSVTVKAADQVRDNFTCSVRQVKHCRGSSWQNVLPPLSVWVYSKRKEYSRM